MPDTPVIVGVDESGRGALAGPVVAGAVLMMDALRENPLIRDSKQLTEKEREKAFAWISEHCIFGYGMVHAKDVDQLGILSATEKAMQMAVHQIAQKIIPTYVLVDGRDKFWFDYPHSSIIEGDQKEPCISAGSIVAKVMRDHLMKDFGKRFPLYTFFEHKGYGTPEHLRELRTHGPCSIHRHTFLTRQVIPVSLPKIAKARSRRPVRQA